MIVFLRFSRQPWYNKKDFIEGKLMDLHVICQFLGRIAWAQSGVMTLPLVMALVFAEDSWLAFLGTMGTCALAGWGFLRYGHVRTKKLTMREGIAITGLGWLLATFLGMLPYCLGSYLNYFDGLFESISGFTGPGRRSSPIWRFCRRASFSGAA